MEVSGTLFVFTDNRNNCGVFITLSQAVPLGSAPG